MDRRTSTRRKTWVRRGLLLAALAAAPVSLLTLPGCAIFGVVANAIPKPPVKAVYTNLQGQTIGVMVWVDRPVAIDWPTLQLNLATTVQDMMANPKDDKGKPVKPAKELTGATFPYMAASVVRYQREHPETEGMSITDVAPNIRVSRLIYVEVEQFQTRADNAVELFRGTMVGTLRVVEVKDGVGKVAYEENDVRVDFPKKAQTDGDPSLGDAKTYAGTVHAFAQEVVNRFVEHPAEDE